MHKYMTAHIYGNDYLYKSDNFLLKIKSNENEINVLY